MAEVDLEQIKALRTLGVKSIEIHKDGAHFVEFFEPAAPAPSAFGAMDVETLLPPPPDAADTEPPPAPRRGAPALARLLKNGSVS